MDFVAFDTVCFDGEYFSITFLWSAKRNAMMKFWVEKIETLKRLDDLNKMKNMSQNVLLSRHTSSIITHFNWKHVLKILYQFIFDQVA